MAGSRCAERIGPGSGGSVRLRSSRPCLVTHMAEAPAMLQVGRHAIDQQKQALAPDPGPNPLYPGSAAAALTASSPLTCCEMRVAERPQGLVEGAARVSISE
jgi:hypothetical protein